MIDALIQYSYEGRYVSILSRARCTMIYVSYIIYVPLIKVDYPIHTK